MVYYRVKIESNYFLKKGKLMYWHTRKTQLEDKDDEFEMILTNIKGSVDPIEYDYQSLN